MAGPGQWKWRLRSVETMHRDLEKRAPSREKGPGPWKCSAFVFVFVMLRQLYCSRPWPPKSQPGPHAVKGSALGLWSTSLGRKVPGSQGDMSTQTMFQVPGITQTKLQVPQNFPRHPTGPSPLPGPAWASTPDLASSGCTFVGLWTGSGTCRLGGSHVCTNPAQCREGMGCRERQAAGSSWV